MPVFSPRIAVNVFYLLIGAVIAISLTSITYALSVQETMIIQEDQADALKWTGSYQPDMSNKNLQIHTYTKLCTGYIIVEETPTATIYHGYGDLANEYSKTIQKSIPLNEKSTTTTEILIDTIPDVTTLPLLDESSTSPLDIRP